MSKKTTATNVTLSTDNQTLAIQWADGRRTVYPLDGLRRACPCATCQGGHEKMGRLPDPAIFEQPARQRWEHVKIEPVGSYGLRLSWDDGHNAGIYTWQRLRTMRPSE